MKRLKRWLLPVFTLLLVAAGAAMPFAAARLQDARQAGAEVWSFDSFRLTLKEEADLSQILRIVAASEYYIEEDEFSETATLTKAEALDAAEDTMTQLLKHNLLEKDLYDNLDIGRVWPQTVVANDGSAAAATWTVQWDQAWASCYIWLDDATGKAIMISIPFVPLPENYDSEDVYIQMDAWRLFLEDYYGVKVQSVYEEWYDLGVEFTFSFPLGEGAEQEIFRLKLYIYPTYGFSTLSPYAGPSAVPPANESSYRNASIS